MNIKTKITSQCLKFHRDFKMACYFVCTYMHHLPLKNVGIRLTAFDESNDFVSESNCISVAPFTHSLHFGIFVTISN